MMDIFPIRLDIVRSLRHRLYACLPQWLMACFFCLALPVQAEPVQADRREVSWLCWVVSIETFYIRCALDVDSYAPWKQQKNDAADSRKVWNELLASFDAGASREELEALFQSNRNHLDIVNFWVIPIYNEPYETSWQEGRPQKLVRTHLCPTGTACRIRFHQF